MQNTVSPGFALCAYYGTAKAKGTLFQYKMSLTAIPVAHLYHLRQHHSCRERLLIYTMPRPLAVCIGERRNPRP
jgi:hypothetical protein